MSFENNSLITLKSNDFLERQRVAGKCVTECLNTCRQLIKNKTQHISPNVLEKECESIIEKYNCVPTFFQYKGFPSKICCSVNTQLVHGICNDIEFKEGDVVKVDLGATYKGAIADAAITQIYGEAKSKEHLDLIAITEGALQAAIDNIKVGKQIGCIGFAINKYVTSKSNYKLVINYGGHSVSETPDGKGIPHASPFIANKAKQNEGVRILPGLTLCIEPMCSMRDATTKTASDGWTVNTPYINCHVEKTIFIHNDGVEVITPWDAN